ncbi:MAG: flippase-like domain-containing protein [Solirubrobacterales bacterium]|nr:flippase-like domain-containing protein [Solirubrobacterales bacterium]
MDDDTPPGRSDTTARSADDSQHPGRSLWRGLIWLVVLVALVVGLLLAVPGLHGVAQQVRHMRPTWVMAGIGFEILSCVGYVVAFLQVFERAPVRFGARVALSELAFNSAVSLGGAGSIAVGAWVLVDRGGNPMTIAQRSAVLFLLTTAINVITLVLAGLGLWLGILPGPANPLLSLLPAAIGTIGFGGVLLLPRFSERLAASRDPGRIRTLLLEAATSIRLTEQVLFRPDWRIIGAIAFLWCDIAVLVVCFAAAGFIPPLAVIVLAYQIGYLSNFVPIPGGIGVLDGSLIGMFALYKVSATAATAATVVYHAIALWVPAVWGTVAFVILQRTRGRPVQLRPPLETRRQLRRARRRTSHRS